jgi:hypothetical protein
VVRRLQPAPTHVSYVLIALIAGEKP